MERGKLGLNLTLGSHQKVIRNSHIAYNRTIHLYFLDAKFRLLGVYCSLNNYFFWFRTQSGPFWGGFGAITLVNNVRLSSKKIEHILTTGNPHRCTNSVKNFFGKLKFLQRQGPPPPLFTGMLSKKGVHALRGIVSKEGGVGFLRTAKDFLKVIFN